MDHDDIEENVNTINFGRVHQNIKKRGDIKR